MLNNNNILHPHLFPRLIPHLYHNFTLKINLTSGNSVFVGSCI